MPMWSVNDIDGLFDAVPYTMTLNTAMSAVLRNNVDYIDEMIKIILSKGYTILEIMGWYFESGSYGPMKPKYLKIIGRISNHTTLEEVRGRYGNDVNFNAWYDYVISSQV